MNCLIPVTTRLLNVILTDEMTELLQTPETGDEEESEGKTEDESQGKCYWHKNSLVFLNSRSKMA